MNRLLVHVEGETEEAFVNEVLRPHLLNHGYEKVDARLFGNARQRDHRGGIRAWSSARNDIVKVLKQDTRCIVTMMVDFYALPQSGNREWPGRAAASLLPFSLKVNTVENALLSDVRQAFGPDYHPLHFIPFVMMHEFEGLLFSDCVRFANGIYQPELTTPLQAIRDAFSSPEEINDSPLTAPSKRIQQLCPTYTKPLLGTLAVIQIGLEAIRQECPHFRQWLETLENYPAS